MIHSRAAGWLTHEMAKVGRSTFLIGGFATALVACRNSISVPCDLVIESTVLEIDRVYDKKSNKPIPRAVLSDFAFDERNFFSDGAIRTGAGPGATLVSPASMRCDPPCGLGYEEHRYSFLVTATGYQPIRKAFDAKFLETGTGCPIVQKGATKVEISLDPQP